MKITNQLTYQTKSRTQSLARKQGTSEPKFSGLGEPFRQEAAFFSKYNLPKHMATGTIAIFLIGLVLGRNINYDPNNNQSETQTLTDTAKNEPVTSLPEPTPDVEPTPTAQTINPNIIKEDSIANAQAELAKKAEEKAKADSIAEVRKAEYIVQKAKTDSIDKVEKEARRIAAEAEQKRYQDAIDAQMKIIESTQKMMIEMSKYNY